MALTEEQVGDVSEILLALKRVPSSRRLEALAIAAKVLIECPEILESAPKNEGARA